jgi:hypothetical protein
MIPVPRKFDIRTDNPVIGEWLEVFLDNVKKTECVVAYNLDKQYILVLEYDFMGNPVQNKDKHQMKKVLYGHVEVRWKTGVENVLSGIV